MEGTGVKILQNGTLDDVSVQSGRGMTYESLAVGVLNKVSGQTTVGAIRALGGDVIPTPTPRLPHHATLKGITAQEASMLSRPVRRTPTK